MGMQESGTRTKPMQTGLQQNGSYYVTLQTIIRHGRSKSQYNMKCCR